MIDSQIAQKLLTAGFEIRRDCARIIVRPSSKLTPQQRQDITDSKLILLADFEATAPVLQWNGEEAAKLCQLAMLKLSRVQWSDMVLVKAVNVIKDRIDYATVNRDLGRVR